MALASEAGASSSEGKTAQVATGTVEAALSVLRRPERWAEPFSDTRDGGAMVGAAGSATAGFARTVQAVPPGAAFTNYVDPVLTRPGL